MLKYRDMLEKMTRWSGIGAVALGLFASCAGLDESMIPGSAASLAKDQIMLVRKEPPSFGFHRLATQSRIHPDIGLFVERHGIPDFLAETRNSERQYFILYYLKARKAFACRTRSGQAGAVEFAGPYPITDGEFLKLDEFRTKKSQ